MFKKLNKLKNSLQNISKESSDLVLDIIKKYAEPECPKASKDVKLNTKNRNKCRKDHDYGPMNPLEDSEKYWKVMAKKWKGATTEEAQNQRCGNCVAFDISSRMKKCMPMPSEDSKDPMSKIDVEMVDKKIKDFPGMKSKMYVGFGYCWMHHFKCHSARTCDTWSAGGPIKKDTKSYDWQEKN